MNSRWASVAAGLVVAGTCAFAAVSKAPAPRSGAGPKTAAVPQMIEPGKFTSSEVCAACHKDIHKGWSASLHALSYTNPSFQHALSKLATTEAPGGPSAADRKKECLGCHAPTTLVTHDIEGKNPLTQEGITCSFCHSIVAAKAPWSADAFTVAPGRTMRGPLQFASSPGHSTQYSPLHRTAMLCAPCHQFSLPSGLAILNTFDEWKAGPWPAQGVQCQDCHMALVPGSVAENIPLPAQISAQDRRLINLHRLVGGSSLGQVRRAMTAKIRQARRSSGMVVVTVDVTNDAAGHRAPTGLPSRSIELKLEASKASKVFHTDQKIYRRDLLDAGGQRIITDEDAFLRAVRLGNDTRLAPGESRVETFQFSAPPGVVNVKVALEYVAAGGMAQPAARRQRFQELNVEVP